MDNEITITVIIKYNDINYNNKNENNDTVGDKTTFFLVITTFMVIKYLIQQEYKR